MSSSAIVPIDEFLSGYALFQQWGPGKSFLAGLATAVVAHATLSTLYDGQLTQRALMQARGLVRKAFRPLVVREIHKKTREMIFENSARVPVHDALPPHGYDNETIVKYAKQLQEDLDLGWDGAHFLSGSVYHGGTKHTDLINRVMELYQWSNPLHMDSFRAVRVMEAEVVEMCVRIFNGHLLRRPELLASFQREGIAAAASATAASATAIGASGTATAAVEGGEKANALTPVTAGGSSSMPMPTTYALATELEDNPCGCMTTGGSDSIAMAVKVYRDFARETRGITNPNLVMPITAHPAFNKACQYFGIRCITVPVCMATGRVEVDELEKYITCDTICVVASACNYPFGTVDPVQDIAAMIVARHNKVGLHVDCCLGGFTIQFLERAGIPNAPIVDFRVPGVTTISCDTHKFGFAPKGTSVVLYRNKKLRMCQFFSIATWPGGIYASPGLNGSRAGNTIAGAWASMLSHGMDGYTRTALATYTTMKKVSKGISEIPSLYVIGIPQASVVAFTSDVIDVYIMAARLAKRTPVAWHLSSLHFPVAVHFSLTFVHSQPGIAEKFLADTREVVMELLAERERALAAGEKLPAVGAQGATVYGSQQRISDRTVVEDVGRVFLDKYFHTHQPSKEQAAVETM